MNSEDVKELKRLAGKYYGYVADMEGAGIEIVEMLYVRDKIRGILDQLLPESEVSSALYERIHELDRILWEERHNFLTVMGERELRYARQKNRSPRSHWWWYLDHLKRPPQMLKDQVDGFAQDLALATG
jgi:hypothetical protein